MLRLVDANEESESASEDVAVGELYSAVVVLSEDEFLGLLRRAATDDLAAAA